MRRGETLGIRLLFINNLQVDTMGLIVLEASDDYCFVETEAYGEVGHYRPSLVCAERHHVITVINLINALVAVYHRFCV